MFVAIVAVDNNWGIGKNGELLFDIPEDKSFFRKMTNGHPIIMGRKTWDSLPVKPLKNRHNTVITRQWLNLDDTVDYCFVPMGAVIKAIQKVKNLNCEHTDVFVIGGGQTYKELLPYCEKVYVTKIFADKPADAFFLNLDMSGEWRICKESDIKVYNGIEYKFVEYERVHR